MGSKQLKTCARALFGLAFTLLMAQPVLAEDASTNDWDLSASFYLWAPDIKGETDGDDVIISLSDILRDLEMLFMGSLGAQKGKWSFLTDIIYMDLEDDSDKTLIRDKIFELAITDIELKAWIVTPMVAYEVLQTDNLDLSLLAGARYLWLEGDYDLDVRFLGFGEKSSGSLSNHAWNGIVGTRGRYTLSEQWYMPFHFDVGTGDSDLTWQAYVGVMYETGNWEIGGGYRYLTWEFDDGDAFGQVFNDLTVKGPMFGAKYRF